jgi:deoxyribonuclease-4
LPCIDWAHLYARTGDGSFNTRAEFNDALDMVVDILGEDALSQMHFHVSGIDYTPKGERAHIPMLESHQQFFDLFQAFVDYGVSGTVGVEAPSPFHTSDALTFQALYRLLRDRAAEE